MNRFNRDFNDFWKNDGMIKKAASYDPVSEKEKNARKSTPVTAPAGK